MKIYNKFIIVVSCVILNKEKKVLLGKRSVKEDVFPGLWGIPGGKVEIYEKGNNTIEDTLIRETKEEMGIKIKPLHYLESSCRISAGKAKLYLIFSAQHISGEPKPLEDTEEIGWFSMAQISKMELTPHTYDNIHCALEKQ